MPTSGIKVLTIGKRFALPYDFEHLDDAAQVISVLARFRPDVIVTSTFTPGRLSRFAFEWRKRWIHVDPNASADAVSKAVEQCYEGYIWSHRFDKDNPLISVYTPTWNSGDFLRETYQSLVDQHYTNWEWVVVDDCSTDGTWERLLAYAAEDPRVRPVRSAARIGKIGAVKDMASRLCRGPFLVELDHDDMLTDYALEEVRKAFLENPDVGFVYSNHSSFFENGTFHRFDDPFWKDRYRETEYRGKNWLECIAPDIYDRFGPGYWDQFAYFLTVAPHHVRAFRASTFRELGGYTPSLPAADDWDLMARFFLRSKCHHIDRMCYLYRVRDNWANATFSRNKAIQDHLWLGRKRYWQEFEAVNEKRLRPVYGDRTYDPQRPVFVVATRDEAGAEAVRRRLEGCEVFVKVGASSILEAYEEGRRHWNGRPRIVYVHDDVEFRDLKAFCEGIRKLSPGLWGVCGSASGSALDADAWWEAHPLKGSVEQTSGSRPFRDLVFEDPGVESDVRWLDGLCLIAVEQPWTWELAGAPGVWHGYDWLASRRAIASGHAVRTIAQPGEPLLRHGGLGRTDTYARDLAEVRRAEASESETRLRDVSYVVLDATGRFADRCLRSIRRHHPGAEIVLVANGVTPSREASELADCVVALEKNLGFSAGSNRGAAAATRSVLCFMNDDAEFVDEAPLRMLRGLGDREIVGPYSDRAKPPQGDIPRENCPAGDQDVEMVVGLCMMMRKELFFEVGRFDPRLLTYDDDDFCRRARRMGVRCRVVGGAWVRHERHATMRALGIDPARLMAENERKFRSIRPRIRVVAIARDEEESLGDFFRQFAPLTTDWCLLDTGSKDRTREVARSLGVRVEEAPFRDFASARNEALDRFSEEADWIVMLDIDERLETGAILHLEDLLWSGRSQVYLGPLVEVRGDGSRVEWVPKPFVFRAQKDFRFVFKVHEKLVGAGSAALVRNATIFHVRSIHSEERRAESAARYKALEAEEPYFTDPAYRAQMRRKWPILDYDHRDDERIIKLHAGPLVTAIVPTYGRLNLLHRAVLSALKQDYAPLEVVVVGDACPELPADYSRNLSRVRSVNLPRNHGAGGAVPRNVGLMLAAGKYAAYLDDDNYWKPDHVSSVMAALRKMGASFAFSSMEAEGVDLGFSEPKLRGIDTSCILHDVDLVRKYGGWSNRAEAGYAHDWEFFRRWIEGGEKWAATRKPTLVYNVETCGQPAFIRDLAEKARR